eukprot:2464399-Pyramimonas_sp.AAC.1
MSRADGALQDKLLHDAPCACGRRSHPSAPGLISFPIRPIYGSVPPTWKPRWHAEHRRLVLQIPTVSGIETRAIQ